MLTLNMSQNLKRAESNITEDSLEAKPAFPETYPSHIHVPFEHRGNRPKQESYLKMNETLNKTHLKLSKTYECKNYLTLNLRPRKQKTYLERFREKFSKIITVSAEDKLERISMDGECGDTARRDAEAESIRSICGDSNIHDFFDTECYNEICYQNLMNEARYFDNKPSQCEELKMDLASINRSSTATNNGFTTSSVLTDGTRRPEGSKSTSQVLRDSSAASSGITRLKSICTRSTGVVRSSRQGSVSGTEFVAVCRLGSLGPDLETSRPRLERARSVQRYSEQVRIDNKLKTNRHKSLQTQTHTETDAPDKKPLTTKPSSPLKEKSNEANNDTKKLNNCNVVKHSKFDQSTMKERDRTMLNKNKLKLNVKKQTEDDFSKGDSERRSSSKTASLNNSFKLACDDFDRRQFACGERLRELEARHSELQAAVRAPHHPHHPHQQRHRPKPTDNTITTATTATTDTAPLSAKSYIWKR